jgi:tetratricopeptide (TPR) repeat protein
VATALSNYLLEIQRAELAETIHPPHELPPRAPGFVGRDRELATLFAALRRSQDGDAVALIGMAGTGKSALAAEAVYALANGAEAFPGGTAWIRCDGRTGLGGLVSVEDQILAAWSLSLTPEELAGATSPERELEARERALRRHFAGGGGQAPAPALLLLDNVEHDLPISRALETLSPLGMHLLLTARHEPSSPRVRTVSLDVLEPDAAVQLFRERYTARGGDWDTVRDRPAAAAAVTALGWLPLAIELAAARAARMHQGVAALGQELTEADRLGTLRDPLEPTRSVRYAFSRSLEILNDEQRARFALVGLPAGPDWPRQFIERLFAGASSPGAIPQDDDLEVLAALSLVTLSGGSRGPRVRLHPLLRDLAREEWNRRLAPARESDIAALVDATGNLIAGHERDFTLLAGEEDVIAGALRTAAAAGVQPSRVCSQIVALEPYLDLGGRWRLGHELFTIASNLSNRTGDPSGEARALNNLGVIAQRLLDLDTAEQAYMRALAIRRELAVRAAEAETLSNLASLSHVRGRPEEAQVTYQQALAIRQELGDRQGEATILGNLGLLAAERGQLVEARNALDRAVEIADPTAAVLNNLGGVAEAQGHGAEARAFFERALRTARAVSDRASEATALDNLGNITRTLGELSQAASYLEQALAIRRLLDDGHGQATTLHNLGVLAEALGEGTQAREYFTEAESIAREVGDSAGRAAALLSLGALASGGRELEAAQGFYEQALTLYHEVGNQGGEALTLAQLGALAQTQAKSDAAVVLYEQALDIQRRLGDRHSAGLLLNSLGLLAYSRGQPAEAALRLREALELLEASGDDDAARTVSDNLAALTSQEAPPSGPEPVLPAAPPLSPVALPPAPAHPTLADEAAPTRRRRWPWSPR